MSTSFVYDGAKGFWSHDYVLGIWYRLLVRTVEATGPLTG
jgi:hypothetical protein